MATAKPAKESPNLVLVNTSVVRVVERTRRSPEMVMGMSSFLPPSTIYREIEIRLQTICYALRSKRRPRLSISLAIHMAEGPDRCLYYTPPTLLNAPPALDHLDRRWFDRMARRLQRVKIETLWRRWSKERANEGSGPRDGPETQASTPDP